MAWHWVGEPPMPPAYDLTWHSQGEAETWLGEFYPELSELGVRAVSLYEESRRVYGPMPLQPDS